MLDKQGHMSDEHDQAVRQTSFHGPLSRYHVLPASYEKQGTMASINSNHMILQMGFTRGFY